MHSIGMYKAGCSSQTQLAAHIPISLYKLDLSVCAVTCCDQHINSSFSLRHTAWKPLPHAHLRVSISNINCHGSHRCWKGQETLDSRNKLVSRQVVFAGPVHWTGKKKTEIGLNSTAKDRTTGCGCTNSEFFRLQVAMFVEKLKNRKKPVFRPITCWTLLTHIFP